MVRAVFLDRDGVIVVPEFRDGRSFAARRLEDFKIYPEAKDCLARLKAAGFHLVVVTNQPDVGAGFVARETVEAMHALLRAQLPIDAIRVCYHTSVEGCLCRKPKPGMLTDAAHEFGIDLPGSFIIGDRKSDVEAGNAARCTSVFVDLGYTEAKPENAAFSAATLTDATHWILRQTAPVTS